MRVCDLLPMGLTLCMPVRAVARCPPVFLQLLLLENVRFYKEEEKNDAEFAKKVRCCCYRTDSGQSRGC